MGRIIAIGGGELSQLETFAIDEYIVKQSQKNNPTALFIPTASGEPEEYISSFKKVYGELLGCNTDILYLIKEQTTFEEIKNKILSADIIYVGGGDTDNMLKIWRNHQVDLLLKEAYQKGTILAGLSAGSICWFEYGHSDSLKYRDGAEQEYILVNGLGFISGIHCPHYNEDDREEDFSKMVGSLNHTGIALENNCAIEVADNQFQIIKSKSEAKAYKVFKEKDQVIKEELDNTGQYKSIQTIIS